MLFKLLTNNPQVSQRYALRENQKNLSELVYLESQGFLDVLLVARDLIHSGHALLTHPLSGSIKPYETPYKSICLSEAVGTLDEASLSIIESAIETTVKFQKDHHPRQYNEKHHQDFMTIDRHLIDSGVESINQTT